MRSRYSKTIFLLAGLLSSGLAISDQAELEVKQYFGNFHGNGLEVAMPLIVENDNNQDGYPESITIRYRVFTAGTTTLVSSTPPQTFPTPGLPAGCTPTGPNFFDFSDTFFTRRGQAQLDSTSNLVNASNRIRSVMNMELQCFDGASDQVVTAAFVYSTDLSGATPNWKKYYTDAVIAGTNGIDTDDDLVNDMVAIVLIKEVANGENSLVLLINNQTGANVLTPQFYAISR